MLSVVMFGGCFMLNDVHRRMRASCLKVSLQGSLLSAVAGVVVLLLVNGFQVHFTFGAVLISFFAALNSIVLSYCGIMALGTINLSLYSLFMMLGGMMLPFWQGIFFYGEKLTVAKIICFVLICAALLVTVEKGKGNKKAVIYYIAIFILNGMSGVFSKIFVSLPDNTATPGDYSIALALWTGLLSSLLLAIFFRKKQDDGVPPLTWKSALVSASSGGINKIANYCLTIALLHVDASVQYPMVTGGVMIVSTITAFLTPNKPKAREIISVAIAFVGLLVLFLLPF
jgi:drug/metabolite transporter (DMT)-like permease